MKFATSIRFNYLMLVLLFAIVTLKGLDGSRVTHDDTPWLSFLDLLDHWLVYFVLPVTTGFGIAAKRRTAEPLPEHKEAAVPAEMQELPS